MKKLLLLILLSPMAIYGNTTSLDIIDKPLEVKLAQVDLSLTDIYVNPSYGDVILPV